MIEQNHAIVMGHKENDSWVEVWQFNLVPQDDGTTRLVIRSRSAAKAGSGMPSALASSS
jgi:hypothetical protein